MGFKMKGFNPGKGTKMGSSFTVTSYDKQEDRPLYERAYMQDPRFSEEAANLPGSFYQSASSIASFGDKEGRDHSAHDAYSGIKDEAAGYDRYSLGAKGAGDEFASDEVKKRNAELRKEAVYNTREANAIGRYKRLEKHYGKGNVPESSIPAILREDGARPDFLKKHLGKSDLSKKEKRQQERQQRKEARQQRREDRRNRRRGAVEEYTPQSSGEYTDKYTKDMDRMIEEEESKKRRENLVKEGVKQLHKNKKNKDFFKIIPDDDDDDLIVDNQEENNNDGEYIPQTQRT